LIEINDYDVIEEIGRGGMATVYKALQPSLNRYVALKVLPPHFVHDEEFVIRFRREALAVAKLQHQNIVKVYEFHDDGELFYLVMELIEGGSLSELIKKGTTLPLKFTADVTAQMGEALHHAHQNGFVHRDIKPSNILLDLDRRAVLTDFGITKAVEGTRLTKTAAFSGGTSEYMSPEQAKGIEVDGRTDLYSLGVVWYEMVTGRCPFEKENPFAVIHSQIYDEPPKPSEFNPELDPKVEEIILKLLEKDADDRYRDGLELKSEIEKLKLPEFDADDFPILAKPSSQEGKTKIKISDDDKTRLKSEGVSQEKEIESGLGSLEEEIDEIFTAGESQKGDVEDRLEDIVRDEDKKTRLKTDPGAVKKDEVSTGKEIKPDSEVVGDIEKEDIQAKPDNEELDKATMVKRPSVKKDRPSAVKREEDKKKKSKKDKIQKIKKAESKKQKKKQPAVKKQKTKQPAVKKQKTKQPAAKKAKVKKPITAIKAKGRVSTKEKERRSKLTLLVAAITIGVTAMVAGYFTVSTYISEGALHYQFKTTNSAIGNAQVTREINVQTDGDRISYVVALRVKEGKGDIEVRESIPKSLAKSVEDISFETEPTAIIKDDPVAMWRLKPKKEGTSIIYRVQVPEKMITKESFNKIIKDYGDLPKLDSINISPAIESINEGQAISLSAIGIMSDESSITTMNHRWTSNDPDVASLDQKGTLTGIKAGKVRVNVSSGDVIASVEIEVLPLLNEILISPKEHSLQVGQTVQLSATGKYTDGSKKDIPIAWDSSDPKIGSVDANGLLTAISAGKITVVARSKGKEVSASVTITDPTPVRRKKSSSPSSGGSSDPALPDPGETNIRVNPPPNEPPKIQN